MKFIQAITFGLFSLFSTSLAAQLPSCEKSLDIDGHGTRQFFNDSGWIFESWEFQDNYQLSSEAVASLNQLRLALATRGSYLILVPVPSRAAVYAKNIKLSGSSVAMFSEQKYSDSWNKMIESVQKSNVDVINLLPQIQRFEKSGRNEDFFYPRDNHWTTSGAEAAVNQISDKINLLTRKFNMDLDKDVNTISFKPKVELIGAFGEHYNSSCGYKVDPMKRYDSVLDRKNLSLLEDKKPQIGIFGDSFGQAYPDNNFSELLENKTQLSVVNYSIAGGGPNLSLAGYLADEKVRSDLPKFIVVPFQGWISNNDFDYNQSTAALLDCNDERMISTVNQTKASVTNSFIPADNGDKKSQRILHIRTSVPTNYLEARGNYADGTKLSFEIYRSSADYFKGGREDFYAILQDNKAVKSIDFKIETNKPFTSRIELCYKNLNN